jgi:hypothetical protein
MASCQMRLLVCGDDDDISSLKKISMSVVGSVVTHRGENMSMPMSRRGVKVEPSDIYGVRRTEIDSPRPPFRNGLITTPVVFDKLTFHQTLNDVQVDDQEIYIIFFSEARVK